MSGIVSNGDYVPPTRLAFATTGGRRLERRGRGHHGGDGGHPTACGIAILGRA